MDYFTLICLVAAGCLLSSGIQSLLALVVTLIIKHWDTEADAMELDLDAWVFNDKDRQKEAMRHASEIRTYRGRDINE
jgi:hypothetical protein